MNFDPISILIVLPVVFALGWVTSRFDLRQWRMENRQAPKDYFRGLNFLLNEQQDQAIDAFIEAVQRDPDTSELHFALGNLFRKRGEYERAVRVHEHLLSRADLSKADRERAQHALAQDFIKAALIDRAEQALEKLEDTRYAQQASLSLLSIHERLRDWPKAAKIASRLQEQNQGDFSARLAHYLCEQAAFAVAREQHYDEARVLLEKAIATAPNAARPRIQLAGLFADQGQSNEAFAALLLMIEHAPQALPLVASNLVRLAIECRQVPRALQALDESVAQPPSIDVTEAIVSAQIALGQDAQTARQVYVHHMTAEPSLIAAGRWLALERFVAEENHPVVQRSIDHFARPLARYRCAACGFETQGYFWQCPGCQEWESFPPRRIEEL